jgi:L-ascorbate metabolism protein UlaG (beta-lactamase superfamily)
VRVTWIGHSTVLLDLDGVRVLTDPLLRRRVVHLVRAADVPHPGEVSAVLVSHVHFDHLDLRSLDLLSRETTVVVPRGAGRLVRKRGFGDVVELVAGETTQLGAIVVHATHAEHRGDRGPFGVKAPTLGFVLRGSGASVFFVGDTGLFPELADLRPSPDVALLPVAGWGPRLPAGHLDADLAAEALRLLQPRYAVPIHWGTLWPGYRRTPYATAADAGALFASRAAEVAPDVEVVVLEHGERWRVGEARPAFIPTGR